MNAKLNNVYNDTSFVTLTIINQITTEILMKFTYDNSVEPQYNNN